MLTFEKDQFAGTQGILEKLTVRLRLKSIHGEINKMRMSGLSLI